MGCSIKAIDDEEDGFFAFCKKVEVSSKDLKDCYSIEYDFARKLHKEKKFKGARLIKGVRLLLAMRDLEREHLQEDADYEKYLELKRKFEPN